MAAYTVFINVLTIFLFMACGFCLVKAKKAEPSHGKSISAFLLYICSPCMIINAFAEMKYSPESFLEIVKFFFTAIAVMLIFFIILYAVLHKKFENPKYRIFSIGSVLGNVGFFGLPLIKALFPGNALAVCYCIAYVVAMNLVVFTVGVFMITQDKKFISLKSVFLNPTTAAVVIALPIYFFGITLPSPIAGAVSLLGNVTTALCMLVLGMRLASVSLKKVFSQPFAYLTAASKLIVFPIFAFLCVCFLPFFDEMFKTTLFVLSAAPSAAFILTLAELHDKEQELAANIVLVATLLSIITLPLLLLLI